MSKRPLWKRLLRFGIFGIVALVTILALAVSWISFDGRRELSVVRKSLVAKGEKLSLVELAPPSVPDDQNFFADPIWQAAPGSRGKSPVESIDLPLDDAEMARTRAQFPDAAGLEESVTRVTAARRAAALLPSVAPAARRAGAEAILTLVEPMKSGLQKVEDLLRRPGAKFPIDYGNPWGGPVSLYPGMISVIGAFSARAQASLVLGDASAAMRDIMNLLQLADTMRLEPLLYVQMLRLGSIAAALGPLKSGIDTHAWSDGELSRAQSALESIDVLPGSALAFRGERGMSNQVYEAIHTPSRAGEGLLKMVHMSEGSVARFVFAIVGPGDQAALNQLVQESVEAIDEVPAKGLDADRLHRISIQANRYTQVRTYSFFYLLGNQPLTAAMEQNNIRQAATACALERYRLARGEYPEKLSDIIPQYLKATPLDVLTLAPMRYQRTREAFTLSAGEDSVWEIEPPPGNAGSHMRPQVRRIIREKEESP